MYDPIDLGLAIAISCMVYGNYPRRARAICILCLRLSCVLCSGGDRMQPPCHFRWPRWLLRGGRDMRGLLLGEYLFGHV